MKELKGKIDQFISFFRTQVNIIRLAKFEENGNLYKKILYVGIIDTLSKTIYSRKGNRDRFVSFVRNFSGWNSCERISLPYLVRLLERAPDPQFSKLRKFALSLFDKWSEGQVIRLDRDPGYREVQKLWPRDKEHIKPIENVQLDSLRHVHLFYTYRNSLIHELRTPGYGIEFDKDKEPFYYSMTDKDENEITSWELVYPLAFFESICETALKNLETYYTSDRIDPYHFFTFGTYWIEELNR